MLTRFCKTLKLFSNKQSLSLKPTSLKNLRFHSDYATCDGLVIEPKNEILWIRLNRPERFNAITADMYETLSDTFTKVNDDKSIKGVLLTGTGEYYSSGNDLTNLTKAMSDPGGPRVGLSKSKNILIRFVDSIINMDKFVIAAINGPAVGIPVTTLALFDYVISSDTASFYSPFTALGQCAEACSSITFPQILGTAKANELLMLNKKWDAQKALQCGLVAEVVEKEKFDAYIEEFLYGKHGFVENCYPQSLKVSKSLVKHPEMKQKLLEANRRESEAILRLWLGEECQQALQKFFKRSKAAK